MSIQDDPAVGYAMFLDREAWGLVIDGLIELHPSAQARAAANSESTSAARANDIDNLLRMISHADPGLGSR